MLRWLSVTVTLAALGAAAAAEAQLAPYGPYYELEVRGGGVTDDGQINFFFPVRQDGQSLLFADIRAQLDDRSGAQGTWGGAYRRLLDAGWIVGANGYFDLRHTESNQRFSQVGAGFEALNLTQGFRANFYLPEDGAKTTAPGDATASAVFVDDNIFVSRPRETAFRGFDIEAEQLLWWSGLTGPEAPAGQPTPDIGWWASLGAFHYTPTEGALSDLTGPRLRTEARIYDLPMLGHDSRLVFGAQLEHDSVRGATGTASIAVRMAIGRPPERGRRITWVEQRMVAPVVRDRRIVTDLITGAAGQLEPAINARIDRLITGARVIDGATPTPEAEIAAAGVDSVIIADGSNGEIVLPSTSLAVGQVLLGGRSGLLVRGAETGAEAVFVAPGVRPTLDFGDGALTLADDSTVIGTILQGADDDAAGFDAVVVANGVTNALIESTRIEAYTLGPGGTPIGDPLGAVTTPLVVAGASSVRMNNSIATGGRLGIDVSDTAEFTMTASAAAGETTALNVSDQAEVVVASGSRLSSGLTTVTLSDDADVTISQSSVVVSGSDPFLSPVAIQAQDNSSLTLVLTNVSALDPSNGAVLGGRGVEFSGAELVVVNSSFQTVDSGVEIIAPGSDTHTLLIAGSLFTSEEAPAISYSGLAGSSAIINATITGNTLQRNGVDQLLFDTNLSGDEVNLSVSGNSILRGFGDIVLSGNIDVTQATPGTDEEGVDLQNGIPSIQVRTSGAIEYDEPDPPVPTP